MPSLHLETPSTFDHPSAQDHPSPDNHLSHDSDIAESPFKLSPIRFSHKSPTRRIASSDYEDHVLPSRSQHTSSPKSHRRRTQRTVSFRDPDSDDSEDGDEGSDEDNRLDGDGDEDLVNDITARRRKFRQDEIDEVKNLFHEFQEEKLKPCAKRLGCTVTRLMRIGRWKLNTPGRRQRGNPWNAYLNHLKGMWC